MPTTPAKQPGDNFYPTYNVVTTQSISGGQAITKGRLYTKVASSTPAAGDGYLVAPADTYDFVQGGIFQATASVPSSTNDGDNTVQCFGPGSRVILTAKNAYMFEGQKVQWENSSGKIIPWTVDSTSTGTLSRAHKTSIGRIFRIPDGTGENTKPETAANDLVIVELGRA